MMPYKNINFILFFLCFASTRAQTTNASNPPDYSYIGLGYAVGRTIPANFYFPETNKQQNLNVTFGKTNFKKGVAWAKHLNYPRSGFLFSYTDFGNPKEVGKAISFMPFMDFTIFNRWTKGMSLQTGLGGSYFNVLYDPVTNPTNLAISTHFSWSFRAFMYYRLFEKKDFNIKIGAGYIHNSNGHIRLPNSGLNSFLATVQSEFYIPKKVKVIINDSLVDHPNDSRRYFSTRLGFGQKVLSKFDNATKNVNTFAFSFGKIKNRTYKYGVGFYYRFYEDYYDYIKNDGTIVTEQHPNFKKHPVQYASNIGIFANFEVLMSHISLEVEMGLNLYKPAYKIDWQINKEKTIEGVYYPAKFGFYYNAKHAISSRLGLRYYALNTNRSPIHNLFLGGTINANLGQADFGELSFGYVYSPKLIRE
jgi:Lipid A 3-O-deacylase (PagL)